MNMANLGTKALREIRKRTNKTAEVMGARADAFLSIGNYLTGLKLQIIHENTTHTPEELERDDFLRGKLAGMSIVLSQVNQMYGCLQKITQEVFNRNADRYIKEAEKFREEI